jgi:hypothetical protein
MRNSGLKRIYFFFSSLFIFLVHLPFVFAKSKPFAATVPLMSEVKSSIPSNNFFANVGNRLSSSAAMLYDSLRLNMMGLSQQAFNYAVQGFDYLVEHGKVANDKIISIVDFSLPSSRKRLFVIDVQHNKVLFNTYVAHGVNSGREYANQFSNTPESNKSSLGFYETQSTYMGGNGYSLKLEGLERGINDNANRRAIVIHGAPYVNEGLIQSQGYIGRSWGCPALPEALHKPIIDKIKNGTCLFIYSHDKNYLSHSRILNS